MVLGYGVQILGTLFFRWCNRSAGFSCIFTGCVEVDVMAAHHSPYNGYLPWEIGKLVAISPPPPGQVVGHEYECAFLNLWTWKDVQFSLCIVVVTHKVTTITSELQLKQLLQSFCLAYKRRGAPAGAQHPACSVVEVIQLCVPSWDFSSVLFTVNSPCFPFSLFDACLISL